MRAFIVILVASVGLLACSESSGPEEASSKPAASESTATQPAQTRVAPAPKPLSIQAPSGEYRLDPNHANLTFGLMHLNLAEYIARFAEFDIVLDLDSENLEASSVNVTINPASVKTGFSGDYKATHQDSPYQTWDEDLSQSPKFLNAGEYPSIRFQSTNIETADDGRLQVDGELSFLGQTKPVTMMVEVTGDVPVHPFSGNGALGFNATGKIKRSDFGMMHLLEPPLVGDEVTIRFSGELHQVVAQAAVPEDNGAEEDSQDSAE